MPGRWRDCNRRRTASVTRSARTTLTPNTANAAALDTERHPNAARNVHCVLVGSTKGSGAVARGSRRIAHWFATETICSETIMKTLVQTTLALFAFAISHVAAADDAATKMYASQCAMCHGPDGKGQTVMGKKLNIKDWSDGKTLNQMTDADVTTEIHVGKQLMPGFTQLSGDQIKALIEYIRTFQK
jgi:mono/diheme cytochrome c family protein